MSTMIPAHPDATQQTPRADRKKNDRQAITTVQELLKYIPYYSVPLHPQKGIYVRHTPGL